MNEYIINPSLLYWAKACDGFHTFFIFLFILGMIGLGIIGFFALFEYINDTITPIYVKKTKQALHWIIPIVVICTLGMIFVPEKNTFIEMAVAKAITKENLSWTIEQIKELINYIVNLFG